jgi:predicted RNase H-like HicB family nuclease
LKVTYPEEAIADIVEAITFGTSWMILHERPRPQSA